MAEGYKCSTTFTLQEKTEQQCCVFPCFQAQGKRATFISCGEFFVFVWFVSSSHVLSTTYCTETERNGC